MSAPAPRFPAVLFAIVATAMALFSLPAEVAAQCSNGSCFQSQPGVAVHVQPSPSFRYTSRPNILHPSPVIQYSQPMTSYRYTSQPTLQPSKPPTPMSMHLYSPHPAYHRPPPAYQYKRSFGLTFHTGRRLNY